MKAKILHSSFLCLTFLWALSVCSPIAYADTDGTEIQVVQPEQLEIQLGPAWTGVEFQLQTDAGLYPEPISVGEDGILRLEIGGSSRYVLSCLSSPVQPAPAAPEVGQPAEIIDAENAIPQTVPSPVPTPSPAAPSLAPESLPSNQPAEQVNEIPVKYVMILGGGVLVAIGLLIGLRIANARREEDYFDDSDE